MGILKIVVRISILWMMALVSAILVTSIHLGSIDRIADAIIFGGAKIGDRGPIEFLLHFRRELFALCGAHPRDGECRRLFPLDCAAWRNILADGGPRTHWDGRDAAKARFCESLPEFDGESTDKFLVAGMTIRVVIP